MDLLHAGMWALSLRTAERENQNTTSTLESYHGVLKRKLFVSKQQLRGREIAWLYYSLTRVVLAAYQHDALLKNVSHWPRRAVKTLLCIDMALHPWEPEGDLFSTAREEEERQSRTTCYGCHFGCS
jgi:hypothetical protein